MKVAIVGHGFVGKAVDYAERWKDSWNRSKAMFDEAGIKWQLNGIKSE